MNHYATVIADAGAARLLMAELLGTDPGSLTPVLLAAERQLVQYKI